MNVFRRTAWYTLFDQKEISPTQKPLPVNTKHSQKTNVHAPAGFKATIPASERPQTEALDRAATGIVN
jgi:hypothetical protein